VSDRTSAPTVVSKTRTDRMLNPIMGFAADERSIIALLDPSRFSGSRSARVK
jgi:hypothetical protein